MTRTFGTVQRRTAAVATGVLLLAGGAATVLDGDESDGANGNVAFVDPAASEALLHEVGELATAVFTIRPGRVAATKKKAQEGLVGSAVETYDELYRPQLRLAAKEGLALVTTVRALGLTRLDGDEAEVLLFADQTAVAKDGRSGTGAAQISLRVEESDGTWRIAGIELL